MQSLGCAPAPLERLHRSQVRACFELSPALTLSPLSCSTGRLPSLRSQLEKPYHSTRKHVQQEYRAADMVRVSMDQHHRLTPAKSAPSRCCTRQSMVLYRHGIPVTVALEKAKEKVVIADLDQLSQRTGFLVKDLQKIAKAFSKYANPATRGLDSIPPWPLSFLPATPPFLLS